MSDLPPIQRFESSSGARIYRIPMLLFPNNFVGYSHVVLNAGPPTLVDTGSGFGRSNDDLMAGIAALKSDFGESLAVTDIDRIVISHGHIDHFGGLAFIVEQIGDVHIGIHPLDRRVLTAYEERIIVATKDMDIYLERSGVRPDLRGNLIEMYGFAKKHMGSVNVDFDLEEEILIEGLEFFHTPGHCPGQVCIGVGDILLTGDHILSFTSPHQAPESITDYTGLGHYRESLRKISHVDGIRLALGGHEDPIEDVYARIDELQISHERKLQRVLDIIREAPEPTAINDISKTMYPDKHNYDILLALLEAGAHVEYLYQRGQLAIANLDEVEKEHNPTLRYSVV